MPASPAAVKHGHSEHRPSVDFVASPSRGPLRRFSDRCASSQPGASARPSEPSCHRELSSRPRGFSPPRRVRRTNGASVVAARSRPWGSPRFPSQTPARTSSREKRSPSMSDRSPRCTHPVKSLPVRSASLTHHRSRRCDVTCGLLPPCRSPIWRPDCARSPSRQRASSMRLTQPGSTPRACSANRSVAIVRRCQRPMTLSFHGLLFSLGPPISQRCADGVATRRLVTQARPTFERFTSKSGTEVPSPR
jgi:hypothetical protein